jgi:HEAT repeat protein
MDRTDAEDSASGPLAAARELGVLILDGDLRVMGWNQWLATATGIAETDIRNRPALDAVPFSNRETAQAVLTEVLGQGTTRVLTPSFHHGFVACPPAVPSRFFCTMQQVATVAPLRDAGTIAGVVVTIEDVTARMEEERSVVADALSSDWRTRAAAARALRQSATRAQIAELLASFEKDHQNFSILSGALQALVAVNRDVARPLVELLNDAHQNIRMHAALALGGLGDRSAVPALIRALDDEDTNVRFHVIEALGRLGAPEAVPVLAAVAQQGDFFVAFPAIDALARIHDPAVVPALLSLLPHELLRPAVVDALGALGDEECIVALTSLLDEPNVDAGPVVSAIAAIAERYEDTLGAGALIANMTCAALTPAAAKRLCDPALSRSEHGRAAIAVAGWLGEPALETLMASLGSTVLKAAVDAAVLRLGAGAVPALLQRLPAESRDVRLHAIALLGRLGERSATKPLAALLQSHDTEIVKTSLEALTRIADPQAIDAVIPLFGHEDFMVRQEALAAVQAAGDERIESSLRPALKDPDPRVRECALRVAGYFGFAGCGPEITSALDDPNEDVRRAAIEQLPLIESADAADRLVSALRGETPRNRAAAAHTLRWLAGAAVEPALMAALDDDAPWVRYFAAGSLETRGSSACVPALVRLAMKDQAPPARIAAIKALSVLAPFALAPLLRDLLEDEAVDVAIAAVTACGRVSGGVPDEVLARAIRGHDGELRIAAAAALGERATSTAVSLLEYAALAVDAPGLAGAAMEALARIAASADADIARRAAAALFDLGLDGSRRASALQLLAGLPESGLAVLEDALASSDAEGRLLAVDALGRMRDPRATAVLEAALSDSSAIVRAAAVAAVGRTGTSAPRERILTLSTSDASAAVRRRAAAICRQYGWNTERAIE